MMEHDLFMRWDTAGHSLSKEKEKRERNESENDKERQSWMSSWLHVLKGVRFSHLKEAHMLKM